MKMTKLPRDCTIEPHSAKLSQISDEVSRIATTLARLALDPEVIVKSDFGQSASDGVRTSIPIEAVESAIQARRLRHRYFDAELFADPAWDMLLDLFRAEIAQHRVSVSSLASAAVVPATTALRWITTMTDAGLFRRRADPTDGRRVFLELSPMASEAMRAYFDDLGKLQVSAG
jgi:DNA-binding MarR family transcriptional regulator